MALDKTFTLGKTTNKQEKYQSIEMDPGPAQILEFADEDTKTVIITLSYFKK